MYMWLIAALLVGGFAGIGYSTGAIRSLVAFVGVILGLALAGILGGLLHPYMGTIGVTNLLWQEILPPVIGFTVIWLIFFGAGFAAHRPVELHFKYREDDATRKAFERMNQALGLFVGLLSGVILFLSVGRPIYSIGYLTTQVSAEAGEPAPVGYINQIRTDMAQTGWDRTFAALDRTPVTEYSIDDLLGLVHGNPLIYARLQNYPGFLALSERQEIVDMAGDADFQKLLQDRAGFTALYTHPKIQSALGNGDLRAEILKTDLKDFRAYVETGKSALFDDEKILGRWRADTGAIITDARRKRTSLQPAELKSLRFVVNSFLKGARLTAYPGGRFVLTIPTPQIPTTPPPAAPAAGSPLAGNNQLSAATIARYGIRQPAAVQPNPAAVQAAAAAANPVLMAQKLFGGANGNLTTYSGEGTWTRALDKYLLSSKKDSQSDIREASISDVGRLSIPIPELKLTLFFVRDI